MGKTGKTITARAPATKSDIVDVTEAGVEDTDKAVAAAEKAQEEWSSLDLSMRGRIQVQIADAIEENHEYIATAETWNSGKPYSISVGETLGSAASFRYYGGYADKILGDVVETDKNHFNFVSRELVGVCGLVVPWNFPLILAASKIAPAMACGNAVVLKSAESTPLSILVLADVIKDIPGLPKGTVNILSGYGDVGNCLATHPSIKKLAFTGSTATGRKIMEAAAKSNLKNVTLELGGKSPNIVLDDCAWEPTLDIALAAIFTNQGKVCAAGSRLLVHENIYERFLADLKSRVEKLKVGDPWDPKTFYGPQTNKSQYEKVLEYIELGKREGATVLTGGEKLSSSGYFIALTIFADVENSYRIAQEEIFGPVLSVIKFKDVDDAIRIANDTSYGLASDVHTTDLNRALYVASKLKAGTVFVNGYNEMHYQMPFGGYGASGIGRENAKDALKNYLEVKSVRVNGVLTNLRK